MTNFLFSFHLPIFSLIDFHVKHNCTCYVTWNYKQHWNMTSMLCLTVQITVLTQSKDGPYTWHEKHHKTVLRAKRLARSVSGTKFSYRTWNWQSINHFIEKLEDTAFRWRTPAFRWSGWWIVAFMSVWGILVPDPLHASRFARSIVLWCFSCHEYAPFLDWVGFWTVKQSNEIMFQYCL